MPLLMCPNCSVSTQQVRRFDVELDMCPQCRGVWLDRGEVEKMLGFERANLDPTHRDHERHEPRRDHRPEYRDDDHDHHRRRKKRFDIFDLFD